MSPFLGEFIGTAIIMVFISGSIGSVILSRSKAQGSGWIVIVLGVGIGVAIGIYSVVNISGAHLNPAITIALASIGLFSWESVIPYIIAQILGAMTGTTLAYLAYFGQWKYTEDETINLAFFATIPEVENKIFNLLTEIIATFFLMFGLLVIIEHGVSSDFFPILIGVLIIAIGFALGGATGYAINPARDFGPRILHAILPLPNKGSSQWKYAWIPVFGPILGAVLGAITFHGFFRWNGTVTLIIVLVSLFTITLLLSKLYHRKDEHKNIVEIEKQVKVESQ